MELGAGVGAPVGVPGDTVGGDTTVQWKCVSESSDPLHSRAT